MVNLDRRCPSGIAGLDELIDGGFPRQRSILLSGTCGSGKTTFAIQFLYRGITEYNEPGILISLEQDPRELKEDMAGFGFDLQKEEDEGRLVIIDASLARAGTSRIDTTITSSHMFSEEISGSRSLLPDEFNIDRILDLVIEETKRMAQRGWHLTACQRLNSS